MTVNYFEQHLRGEPAVTPPSFAERPVVLRLPMPPIPVDAEQRRHEANEQEQRRREALAWKLTHNRLFPGWALPV
ncbi:hypothetical protein LJR175_003146 [Variovorax sp. LjRoot175]|uniref:hypothetical protein n=1 Tax=Variovorax sp. LjRoot175 TaxID=3342276 RepID=UPI003ECE3F5A